MRIMYITMTGGKNMREMKVYYCSNCGCYGTSPNSENPVCPACKSPMNTFSRSGRKAMAVSLSELELLKARNHALEQENMTLRRKNAGLEKTVGWMHDMIWDLTKRLHGISAS